MAADPNHIKEASRSFVTSDGVFCVSQCQSCSLLKKDLHVLVNQLKSITEIINILKDELKYNGATKQDWLPNSVCEVEPKISALQCDNCSQLDNQLKLALNELSSVKLITEILNKEIKILKQTSRINFNPSNTWSTAKSSDSRSPTEPARRCPHWDSA